MTYYDLILEAEYNGIDVVEKKFKSNAKGLCKGAKIAINTNLLTCEKACILAEELGHYYTSVGDILDQNNIINAKQEYKARAWAVEKILPFEELEKVLHDGCKTVPEIAEYLNLDEEFVQASAEHYKRKLGIEFPLKEVYEY